MIFEQHLAAIDPLQLAADSGATVVINPIVPRFRAPLPRVIRPHLLTEQLRGCDCHMAGLPPDYGGMRGLGYLGFSTDPNTFDINALQVPAAGTTGIPSGTVSALQTMATGTNFIPGIGPIASNLVVAFTQYLHQLESWLGIGAGRHEADIIVPTQNNLMTALGGITNQILVGQNPPLATLMSLYRQVWMMGVAFQEYVLQRQFTDRRASGQALNTVMPYIDGSCGYAVPIGFTAAPSSQNCLSWGDGTVGGVGTNGMLGAIGRAIVSQGGTVQALPELHSAANSGIKLSSIPLPGTTILGLSTPIALALGIGVLVLYKRGLR